MAPRKGSTRPPKIKSTLLTALEFVTLASKEIGPAHFTHLFVTGQRCTASNGVVSAGSMIDEDLTVCPHAHLMLEAMSKAGNQFQIVQTGDALSVKSDDYSALVPCAKAVDVIAAFPDSEQWPCNSKLLEALEACGKLAIENAESVVAASVMIRSGSVVGTNRQVILEYWHGNDMPPMILPKAAVSILIKVKKEIRGFGYSAESLTLWYSDNTWMKSQLYTEAWPDVDKLLNVVAAPKPIQKGFFEALDAVEPFSEGTVHFNDECLTSNTDATIQYAVRDVKGLPCGPSFGCKNLDLIRPHVKLIDWACGQDNKIAYFTGEGVRGVVSHAEKGE